MRLLRTPRPQVDESVIGYILRLTEKNGYDTPSWIINFAGLKILPRAGGVLISSGNVIDLSRLGELAGLEPAEIERLAYPWAEHEVGASVRGLTAPITFTRLITPQVCPACLSQYGYCSKLWELLPFTACPVHETVLLDTCPQCGESLSWLRKKVSVCRCDCDWRYIAPIEASTSTVKLAQQFKRLCGLDFANELPTDANRNPLYGLNLADLCLAVNGIADYYSLATTGHHITARTKSVVCHECYSFAFSVFDNWPEGLYELYEWAERRVVNWWDRNRLHKHLCNHYSKRSLHFMVVAFEDQLDKACFSDSNLILPFHRRFITKAEACARLNVSQSWLESLIAQGRLETFRRGPSEAECLIDAESIDQFKAEIRFFIPAVEAAELLKIDVYDIYDLVRHGCLKPQSGPTVDGSIEWRFDMEELIDLLMRVFEKTSATMSTVKNREMMDTRDVFQYLNAHQLSVGRFMHSVFDGEVTPQALQPRRGLLHFLFLRKQIVDYKRRFCPMKEHSPVSVNDASDGKHYSDKAGDRYKDASSTKQTNEDMKRLSVIVIFLETQWELNDRIYTNNTNKRIVPYEANQLTYSMKLFICSVSDSAS